MSLLTLLILFIIIILIKAFEINIKMGFYKLFANLPRRKSIGSIFKNKNEYKLVHNKPNSSDEEDYYFLNWFVGFTDASNRRKYSTSKVINNNELSLVVWGQNLTSQVGQGKFTKLISSMIKLPNYYKSIIIGLLSDGWLTIASKTTKNARLGFKQYLSKTDYVWFVFNELSHYCSSYPQLTKGIKSSIPFYGLQFFTRSLPCFTKLHQLFYINKTRIIP